LFRRPVKPDQLIRWPPLYVLPWNSLFLVLGKALWLWAPPSRATLDWPWMACLLARIAAIVRLVFGALELRHYIRSVKGNLLKFIGTFPGDKPSSVFMFGSQNIDNI
jgi:hypothetical protein